VDQKRKFRVIPWRGSNDPQIRIPPNHAQYLADISRIKVFEGRMLSLPLGEFVVNDMSAPRAQIVKRREFMSAPRR